MLEFAPFVIATSLVVAIGAVLAIEAARRRIARSTGETAPEDEGEARFVFDRETLIDVSPAADMLIAGIGGYAGEGLGGALAALAPRFPGVRARIDALDQWGRDRMLATDGSAHLDLSRHGDILRLDVVPIGDANPRVVVGAADLAALKHQAISLRAIADALPYAVWCCEARGQVAWVNRAYLELCESRLGAEAACKWPPERLFAPPSLDEGFAGRLWLGDRHEGGVPFEVTSTPHEGGVLCTAIPADAAMRTEASLRDFVQTLTKTFAQISIGLAVFSRERRLVLFNPALGELTGLRPESLALRPTLFEFLDTLRDRRLMPEPKDYKSWRQRLADLRNGGPDGQMIETWQLADGRSFRVTALPQPEGSMALLFEDITSQMVQNRNFRGTLEMHQLVLDRRSEAIAVFAPDGALVLCNDAYDALWRTDVSGTVAPVSLAESLQAWTAATQPTPAWATFPQTISGGDWAAQVQMTDGRAIDCRVSVLAGSCLLVEFRIAWAGRVAGEGRAPRGRLKLMA